VRRSPDSVTGTLVGRAARNWRYRPATKDGAAVRYRMMVKVAVGK
jgi:hypothetical protein